jgi:hypothetical protein
MPTRLLHCPDGRRDRKVQGGRVERDELRQQAHDTLGILRPVERHAIIFLLKRYVDEASSRAAALHGENSTILSLIECPAQHECVRLLQGEDAPQKLVDAERRARNDLVLDRTEWRPSKIEDECPAGQSFRYADGGAAEWRKYFWEYKMNG